MPRLHLDNPGKDGVADVAVLEARARSGLHLDSTHVLNARGQRPICSFSVLVAVSATKSGRVGQKMTERDLVAPALEVQVRQVLVYGIVRVQHTSLNLDQDRERSERLAHRADDERSVRTCPMLSAEHRAVAVDHRVRRRDRGHVLILSRDRALCRIAAGVR